MKSPPFEMKVSGGSPAEKVASALAKCFQNHETDKVLLLAIGASAVNQAVKAVAIARGMTASAGFNLICTPAFRDVEFDDKDRTGITLIVENI